MNLLARFMALASMTDAQMAEKVGCDRSTIAHARNGTRIPKSRMLRRAIAQATDGAVPEESWEEPADAA